MPQKTISFNRVKMDDLVQIVNIREQDDREVFREWFGYDYPLSQEDTLFLENLIDKYGRFVTDFSEEELKIKYLAPVLNRVDYYFGDVKDWYERPLKAKISGVWLKGTTDFMVARGISEPRCPYFFIQEFKKARGGAADPKSQLLAEMLVAMKLSEADIMRGAYIIGRNWIFVILKQEKNGARYPYFLSKQFDSLEIGHLKQIYVNLQAVKYLYCQ